MIEYIPRDALKAAFEEDGHLSAYVEDMINSVPVADVAPGVDFRDCRNELCYRCGDYKQRHLGACDSCRWKH